MWRQRAVERERATRRIRAVRLSDGLIVQRWLRDRTRAERWRRHRRPPRCRSPLGARRACKAAPLAPLALRRRRPLAPPPPRRGGAPHPQPSSTSSAPAAPSAAGAWPATSRTAAPSQTAAEPAQKEAASALAASTAATVARKGVCIAAAAGEGAAVGAARDRVAVDCGCGGARDVGSRCRPSLRGRAARTRCSTPAPGIARGRAPRWCCAGAPVAPPASQTPTSSRYRAAADVADAVALSAAVRRWERAAAAAAAAGAAARRRAYGGATPRAGGVGWRIGRATDRLRHARRRRVRDVARVAGRARDARLRPPRFAAARSCGGAAFLDAVARLEVRRGRNSSRRRRRAGGSARSRTGAAPTAARRTGHGALPIADEVRRRLLAAEDLLAALAARRRPVRALQRSECILTLGMSFPAVARVRVPDELFTRCIHTPGARSRACRPATSDCTRYLVAPCTTSTTLLPSSLSPPPRAEFYGCLSRARARTRIRTPGTRGHLLPWFRFEARGLSLRHPGRGSPHVPANVAGAGVRLGDGDSERRHHVQRSVDRRPPDGVLCWIWYNAVSKTPADAAGGALGRRGRSSYPVARERRAGRRCTAW